MCRSGNLDGLRRGMNIDLGGEPLSEVCINSIIDSLLEISIS